jgi:hypothetical protein
MLTDAEVEARTSASDLIARHKLRVPAKTAEMLANTILKCRVLPRRTKQMEAKLPRRRRMQRALAHARKLLEYKQRGTSHADGISTQVKWLRSALNDREVVMWLACAQPRLDASKLFYPVSSPSQSKLVVLVRALEYCLSSNGDRTGRPRTQRAAVVAAGCITWFRAGRKLSCTWNGVEECTTGPLAEFMRALLKECRLDMMDAALYSALRDAIHYVKNHPNLRSASVADFAKKTDFPS